MKCHILFSRKSKKNITNLSSTEPACIVVSVKYVIKLHFEISEKQLNIINHGLLKFTECRPRWLSCMRRPTGDQEVAGSTPTEVGNIVSWRLIMKYFLWSFSPFR